MAGWWRRVADLRPVVLDGALALVLTAGTQVELSVAEIVEGPEWAQRAAFLVTTLAVGGRRIAPLPAALVGALGMAVQTPLGMATVVGGFLALMIVTHAVALRCDRGGAVVGLVAVLIGVHLYDVLFWAESGVADLVGNAAIFLAIWGLGRGAREWRSRTERLRRDAAAAERAHEARTRDAVRYEQARIARELHDIVAHGISVMTLQAGAARQVLGPDPGAVHAALLTVEEHGRRSLDEMHRLLGILRRGEDGVTAPTAVRPVDVADLVDRTRALGLPVALRVEGEPGDIAPSLALSVHRIIQESLTNALRHGAREDVAVRLHYASDAVEVDVRDAGPPTAPDVRPPGAGLGLVGMRERVAVFGGELAVGRADDGAWSVRARLPRVEAGGVQGEGSG